jgi:hypothetical protein
MSMSDRSIGHGPGKTADPWIPRRSSRLVQISTHAWLCAPRRFLTVRSGGRSSAGMAPSVAPPAPATAPAQPAPPRLRSLCEKAGVGRGGTAGAVSWCATP